MEGTDRSHHINDLEPQCLTHILSYLPASALCAAAQVQRAWLAPAQDDLLWQPLLAADWLQTTPTMPEHVMQHGCCSPPHRQHPNPTSRELRNPPKPGVAAGLRGNEPQGPLAADKAASSSPAAEPTTVTPSPVVTPAGAADKVMTSPAVEPSASAPPTFKQAYRAWHQAFGRGGGSTQMLRRSLQAWMRIE
ncbi:F-box-like, partial [Haematococcus lacustris]